jgi:hypothetical protein
MIRSSPSVGGRGELLAYGRLRRARKAVADARHAGMSEQQVADELDPDVFAAVEHE